MGLYATNVNYYMKFEMISRSCLLKKPNHLADNRHSGAADTISGHRRSDAICIKVNCHLLIIMRLHSMCKANSQIIYKR